MNIPKYINIWKKLKDLKIFELDEYITWSIVRHIAIRLEMLVVFARKQRGGKGTLSRTAYSVFH